MKVREIMSPNVQQISASATVTEAAEKMKEHDVGALPVLEKNRIVGLLTDRDIILRVVASYLDPKMTVVKDAYTPKVVCCSQDDEVRTAAETMEAEQVRRLVVLGDENTVVGILSVGDLALKTGEEHMTFEVLERVCARGHN